MSTTHTPDPVNRHPGHPLPKCSAVLCHGRLQLAWDPASGHHRLAISQAPSPRVAKVPAMN